jgi:hypothetical protein
MVLKNKIWELLKDNKSKSVDDIYNNLNDYNPVTIKQYLNALYKAKYLNAKNITTRGLKNNSSIKLIKNTGSIAPTYSKGVLRDLNTLEEFIISKDKTYKKTETYLKFYLQAIVELNKEEALNSEIVNKFKEICPSIDEDDKKAASKIKRYRDQLLEKGAIIKSGDKFRNSCYLQINLKQIKFLYNKCKNINTYNILKKESKFE